LAFAVGQKLKRAPTCCRKADAGRRERLAHQEVNNQTAEPPRRQEEYHHNRPQAALIPLREAIAVRRRVRTNGRQAKTAAVTILPTLNVRSAVVPQFPRDISFPVGFCAALIHGSGDHRAKSRYRMATIALTARNNPKLLPNAEVSFFFDASV